MYIYILGSCGDLTKYNGHTVHGYGGLERG